VHYTCNVVLALVVDELSIIDNDVIYNVHWDTIYDALVECNVVEWWLA